MSPTEFLSRILGMLARAASARTPRESVEDASDAFRHLCAFDEAALLLPSREKAQRRSYVPAMEIWRIHADQPERIPEASALASVGTRGRALIASAQGLQCPHSRDFLLARGFSAALALPLRVEDRPIGTLAFFSSDPRAFAAVDLGVLLAGAAVVAVAVEHSRDRAALERLTEAIGYRRRKRPDDGDLEGMIIREAPARRATRTPTSDLRPLADIERDAIARVLAHTRGRVSGPRGAAAILRMKPTTLASRMKKLGVPRKVST